VIVTVTTYALVIFHNERVCTVQPTPHHTGRTCKATHPTRSTSSCGALCLGNCPQIPRFDRCSASQLCCMAVHLPCTFTTHQVLMARLCVSRVPVEPIKVAFSRPCFRNRCPLGIQTVGCDCPERIRYCVYYDDGRFLASLVAIGDDMPEAHASVGLPVTIRNNCLYFPLGVGDAFDNLPNGRILRGVHVSTDGTTILGGQWVHPILLGTCSKRP
jgi:hypothetical protein